MTYNVFGGTLSLTQSINHVRGRRQRVEARYVKKINRHGL